MKRRRFSPETIKRNKEHSRITPRRLTGALALTAAFAAASPSTEARTPVPPSPSEVTAASAGSQGEPCLVWHDGTVPIPEAFCFMSQLSQRAEEAVISSGQDPNDFIKRDPSNEVELMQEICSPDEPTSITLKQKSRKVVSVRVGKSESQSRVALMSSKIVTNSNIPRIPGTAYEGDCDLVDEQYAEAQPMWRASKKARFKAIGAKIALRNPDLLLFKFPGSRASTSSVTGELHTTRPITAADRKKGKFGIKFTNISMPRTSEYGQKKYRYGGVYVFTSRSGRQIIKPNVTAPVQPFNHNSG